VYRFDINIFPFRKEAHLLIKGPISAQNTFQLVGHGEPGLKNCADLIFYRERDVCAT
jgi:hypothetical protein